MAATWHEGEINCHFELVLIQDQLEMIRTYLDYAALAYAPREAIAIAKKRPPVNFSSVKLLLNQPFRNGGRVMRRVLVTAATCLAAFVLFVGNNREQRHTSVRAPHAPTL